uniref:Uncharacterized protein n=1 Tax=Anguilla anguilla TaxID=7936 RepID=A0A0E9UP93_ANGAN
MCIVNASRKKC